MKYFSQGKQKTTEYTNKEDNFGLAFRQNVTENTLLDSTTIKKEKEPQATPNFHCGVCNVNTTCQDQLDNHFRYAIITII